jgi:lysophospholipase L1-like esterase
VKASVFIATSLDGFIARDQRRPRLVAGEQPKPELFQADSLHMTRAGYRLWRERLAPVVH